MILSGFTRRLKRSLQLVIVRLCVPSWTFSDLYFSNSRHENGEDRPSDGIQISTCLCFYMYRFRRHQEFSSNIVVLVKISHQPRWRGGNGSHGIHMSAVTVIFYDAIPIIQQQVFSFLFSFTCEAIKNWIAA